MKKKIATLLSIVFILMTALSLTACEKAGDKHESIFSRPIVAKVAGQKKAWLDVDSFVCYYGGLYDTEQNYKSSIEDYDVAICESRSLGADGIKKLNDAGVWTICYITVGEDDSLNVADGLGAGGYASYYFYEEGAPLMNGNWGSYFVDGGNPVWQARVISRAREIIEMGADGLFLDTLDTVDIPKWGNATIGGMVSLVKLLRDTFPDIKIVANRGFTILEYIAPYIDGMMFESFNTTWNFETNKATDLSETANNYNISMAVNIINKQRQYYYFPVFALDYVNESDLDYLIQHFYNRSWQYDFIPYAQAHILLNEITRAVDYNTGELIRPNSKRGELALKGEGEIAQNEGKPNGDTSASNLAYGGNVTVEVSSYYSIDYKNNGSTAINDAFISETMYWAKRAWASQDETPASGQPYKNDHYITFTWQEAKSISKIKIYWGFDSGVYYSSQAVKVQIFEGGVWTDIATESDIPSVSEMTQISFSAVSASRLRVVQPAGMGASFRPGIMWVGEVEIYA